LPVGWLKERFPKARTLVWSASYDPDVIEKMGEWGVDAYVHKQEAPEEIRKAYLALSAGGSYISEIFRTLYSEYGMGRKNPGITGIGRSQ
jgi:DNA-binding NarL/FixJ family response regulator